MSCGSQLMRRKSRAGGFTLLELLVVLAIIAMVAGILFPVLAQAQRAALKATCQSNLRFNLYLADYAECFPNTGDPYLWMGRRWRWPLQPYLALAQRRDPAGDPNLSVGGGPGILLCPAESHS